MTDSTKPEPPELPADFGEPEGYCGECGHYHCAGWCDLFHCECRNSALRTEYEGYCHQCQHYHNAVGCDLAGCDCRYDPVYVE